MVILDSTFSNTPIGIAMGRGSLPKPPTGNSIILENVDFTNVRAAIQGPNSTVLAGSVGHVDAWGQGNSFSSSGSKGTFQGSITPNVRPAGLTSGKNFYAKSKPYYGNVKASKFVSARKSGAVGDGVTDDTDALNEIFEDAALSGKIVYISAGYYLVTKTIYVPPGVKIFGEAVSGAPLSFDPHSLTLKSVPRHFLKRLLFRGQLKPKTCPPSRQTRAIWQRRNLQLDRFREKCTSRRHLHRIQSRHQDRLWSLGRPHPRWWFHWFSTHHLRLSETPRQQYNLTQMHRCFYEHAYHSLSLWSLHGEQLAMGCRSRYR